MIKLKRMLSVLATGSLLLLLTACQHTVVVLQPDGPVAAAEKHLLITAVLLMLIVVIPVILLVFIIARRYRASNTKAKYTPEWCHSNALELVWWTIPIVIIAILATITWITTHQLDPYKPLDAKALGVQAKPVQIQAIALRWKWLFIYPQYNMATVNYVKIPVKTPINFQITSDAPMNSFQIQQLAGQIYAMNGMQTKLHMLADNPGSFRGRSVSFSGNGFYGMRFVAKAVSKTDFKAWVASVKHSPKTLDWAKYNTLVSPSENVAPSFYSSVTPGLFHKVIMKFMMPKKHYKADGKPLVHL